MPDSLLKAVQNYFTSNSTLSAALTGGLWTSEVPEDTSLPYGALDHEGTVYEHHFNPASKFIEHSRFCIHIYAVGAEAADTLIDTIVTQYRNASLPYTTKQCMAVIPLNSMVESTPGRYRDGTLIYHGYARFDVRVSTI